MVADADGKEYVLSSKGENSKSVDEHVVVEGFISECWGHARRWSSALDGLCIKVKVSFSQNLPPRNREFDDTPCSNSISRFDMVTGEFDDMPHPESGDCLRQSRDEMSLRKMDEQLP